MLTNNNNTRLLQEWDGDKVMVLERRDICLPFNGRVQSIKKVTTKKITTKDIITNTTEVAAKGTTDK